MIINKEVNTVESKLYNTTNPLAIIMLQRASELESSKLKLSKDLVLMTGLTPASILIVMAFLFMIKSTNFNPITITIGILLIVSILVDFIWILQNSVNKIRKGTMNEYTELMNMPQDELYNLNNEKLINITLEVVKINQMILNASENIITYYGKLISFIVIYIALIII